MVSLALVRGEPPNNRLKLPVRPVTGLAGMAGLRRRGPQLNRSVSQQLR
jgi:hypothetical protein